MFVIKYKKLFLTIGALLTLVSLVIIGTLGLKLGIDFTGGALTEVAYGDATSVEETQVASAIPVESDIENALTALGLDLGGFSVRRTNTDDGRVGYMIRTRDLAEEERVRIDDALLTLGNGGEILRFTTIGPVIGEELKDKAIWAIFAVCLVIVLYVAFAFRGVSHPVGSWVYGSITIMVLLHDVIVPTAAMVLMGYFLGVEVDVLFVMALLAVLGYSVNDTIVVFDRVRENLEQFRQEKKVKKNVDGLEREEIEYILTKPFENIVGSAVGQTLLRSINTSFTTMVTLLALYIVGGSATTVFALILLIGVFAGTYSSIFLASPLLVFWAEHKAKAK